MSELAEIFVGETREHLDILNDSLMELEKDPENKEIINEIFRVVHTMKGSSAMMGLMKMENMAHGMEDVLHDVRDGKLKVDAKLVELLFVCHDFLLNCLESVIQNGDEGDFKSDQIMKHLHEIIQANQQPLEMPQSGIEKPMFLDSPELIQQAQDLAAQGYSLYQVQITFKPETQLVSVRALIVYQILENQGVLLKADPEVPAVKEGNLLYEPEQLVVILASQSQDAAILQSLAIETEIIVSVQPLPANFGTIPSVNPFRLVTSQERKAEGTNESDEVDQLVAEIIDGPAGPAQVIEIDREFRADFLAEMQEYLGKIELGLSELAGPVGNAEILYRIYRLFHTIGGLAGFIGFGSVKKITDHTKRFLNQIRKAEHQTDQIVLERLLISGELIRQLITETSEQAGPELSKKIEQHLQDLESGTKGVSSAEAVIATANLQEPPAAKQFIKQEANRQPLLVPDASAEPSEGKGSPTEAPGQPARASEPNKRNGLNGISGTEFARIPTYKIDGMVDKIGELLILQAQIEQSALQRFNANDELVNKVLRMERLIKDLQSQSMSMRMVSLKATFQKINRVARDAINELGKNVNYLALGEDTEIDRGVAEKIQDPLLHMVKNSISHGIESEAERIQLGKPPQGEVKIQAYNKKGNIYIEISDDGRGLSLERILTKAIEKGLADPAKKYRDEEIIDFIFLPGFSTAEKVNHISGRGVGLDVVKTEMARIGGKIEVRNFPAKGCTFILKIPINFAALNGIIAEIFGYRCVIPTLNVKQIIQPRPEQWIFIKGKRAFFKVRDEVLPVVPIAKAFGVAEPDHLPENSLVIILEMDKHQKALPIAGISGRKEVVVKPLDREFKEQKFASGVSILGDGKLAMILDVENLFKIEN
jgi:two-component system chemotaxis sensor kinase CheA